jgi:hypothetical protein
MNSTWITEYLDWNDTNDSDHQPDLDVVDYYKGFRGGDTPRVIEVDLSKGPLGLFNQVYGVTIPDE